MLSPTENLGGVPGSHRHRFGAHVRNLTVKDMKLGRLPSMELAELEVAGEDALAPSFLCILSAPGGVAWPASMIFSLRLLRCEVSLLVLALPAPSRFSSVTFLRGWHSSPASLLTRLVGGPL